MYIHLDRLKAGNPALYRAVIAHLGFMEGIRQVDPDEFPTPIKRELHAWADTQRPRTTPAAPAESTSEFSQRLAEFKRVNATPPAPFQTAEPVAPVKVAEPVVEKPAQSTLLPD